jgi:hypothetical protein
MIEGNLVLKAERGLGYLLIFKTYPLKQRTYTCYNKKEKEHILIHINIFIKM